jgi:hypothetical protein
MAGSFSYERVKHHTGKVQYRIDGASAVSANGKSIKSGEVRAFKNPAYTNGLVATGNFAHVPADTPLGLPADETTETPEPTPAPAPPPLIEENQEE